MRALLTVLTVLAASTAACEGEGKLQPLGPPELPPEPPPSQPAEDAGVSPPGPKKRTVELRSWAGGPAGNLLVDGDFELSGVGDGQAGWRAFASGEQVRFDVETGGLCKSGLRCGRMKRDVAFWARGTAAPGGKHHLASVWAKLPDGYSCKAIVALLVACDTGQSLVKLKRDDDLPDATGWCRYQAELTAQESAVCLYVDNQLSSTSDFALIDAAVLAPNDGTVSLKSAEAWAPSADDAEKLAEIADYLRRTQPFGIDKVERARDRTPAR